MDYSLRYGVVIAVYLASIAVSTVGRELRPSDHGLAYHHSPATNSPEMLAFFGGEIAAMSPEKMPLPEARNMSGDPWWSGTAGGGGGGGGRGEGRDHVREVLLVASLVCGGTGVLLLVVAGFIFLFQFRKRRSASTSTDENK